MKHTQPTPTCRVIAKPESNQSLERRHDEVHTNAWSRRSHELQRRFGVSEELKGGELPHHVLFYKLHNKWTLYYRSFCAGSILSEIRVLSSSKCFLTNKKNPRITLKKVKVVAGSLTTMIKQPTADDSETEQWRSIKTIYSQMFYRYPAYNLCVVEIKQPWIFNYFVSKIPMATKDLNFDGVCESVSMRATKSWSVVKHMFREQLQMIRKQTCENMLLRSCRLFYCTVSMTNNLNRALIETEGAGLVCHGTGDPAEEDEDIGVLVGVTALVNVDLPSLHNRVGMFNKWIEDTATWQRNDWLLIIVMLLLNFL